MSAIPREGFARRLRRHAEEGGERPALVTPERAVGYRELADRVDACAHALQRQGVASGDIAAVAIRDESLHMVATLALFALGVPQATAGSHEPVPMRARLASRIGVTVVVASDDADRLDGLGFARVRWDEPFAPSRVEPRDDDAVVYFTGSGTTGEPKIVAVTERQLAVQADRGYALYGPERVLRLASVEHNNSKRLRLYCLWQGGACVFRGAAGEDIARLCDRLAVSWLDTATYHLEDFVRAATPERRLPLRTRVRCGGSRVPFRLRQAVLSDVTPHLHVSYGTTETAGMCLSYPHEHANPNEPVGRPLPGVDVEIVDAARRPVPPGEAGEIRLRAPAMVDRYVGDPEATRRRFADGWFYPGDAGFLLPDGALCVQGRLDDMMILNGMNIYPAEVERVLESMPGVRNAACLALRSPVHGEIPVAAVEVAPGGPAVDAIARFAREQLGMRAPRRVVVLDALPRNTAGKVAKREIAALLEPGAARAVAGRP